MVRATTGRNGPRITLRLCAAPGHHRPLRVTMGHGPLHAITIQVEQISTNLMAVYLSDGCRLILRLSTYLMAVYAILHGTSGVIPHGTSGVMLSLLMSGSRMTRSKSHLKKKQKTLLL